MDSVSDELDEVMALVVEHTGLKRATPDMAIDELGMSGDDVTDFVQPLADRYGEWMWTWPWQRFACLDEGLSPLWPLALLWQLATWSVRGSFAYPSAYERLTPRHIAHVLQLGEWVDP